MSVRPYVALPQIHEGVLDAAGCARVKKLAEDSGFEASNSAYGASDLRRCRSTWLPPGEQTAWLYRGLAECFEVANRTYGFALQGFLEPLMVARYRGGDRFDWHLDIGPELSANRKLSMSLMLDDAADYEGGELEFAGAAGSPTRLSRGSAIVFPAYLAHRVNPVGSGQRDAVVAFAYGPSFT